MDAIEKLANILASWIAESHNAKELEKILEFIIFLAILVFVFFARQIIRRIPFVRRRINEGERYAGRYVQIIGEGVDRRYSVLDIRYGSYSEGYLLVGFQYDPEGRRAIDFESENVAFRRGASSYLEFVWSAETLADKSLFNGYTQMYPDDSDDLRLLEGRGFFITFDKEPRRFDLEFIKLSRYRLRELGLKDPKTDDERSSFVKQLHEKLSKDAEVRTVKEVGKALL